MTVDATGAAAALASSTGGAGTPTCATAWHCALTGAGSQPRRFYCSSCLLSIDSLLGLFYLSSARCIRLRTAWTIPTACGSPAARGTGKQQAQRSLGWMRWSPPQPQALLPLALCLREPSLNRSLWTPCLRLIFLVKFHFSYSKDNYLTMPLLIALQIQKWDTLQPFSPRDIFYFLCLPAWPARLPRLFSPLSRWFPSSFSLLRCLVPGTQAGRGGFYQHSWTRTYLSSPVWKCFSWSNSLKRVFYDS